MKPMSLTWIVLAALAFGSPALLGCKGDAEEPASEETVGEEIEGAAEETGDAVEEGADETGDAIEEAGDEIDQEM